MYLPAAADYYILRLESDILDGIPIDPADSQEIHYRRLGVGSANVFLFPRNISPQGVGILADKRLSAWNRASRVLVLQCANE